VSLPVHDIYSLPTETTPRRIDLMRGEFAMVEFVEVDGSTERRLVLISYGGHNRKLVYRVRRDVGSFLSGNLIQDSPGMGGGGLELLLATARRIRNSDALQHYPHLWEPLNEALKDLKKAWSG
jgi:hypothetical protein